MALPDLDSLWDYNDPAKTEERFRDLLDEAEESDDISYYLQLQTQLARTLSLQFHFDEAHEVLDDVAYELTKNNDPIAQIRYQLERGRVFNSNKKYQAAHKFFLQAYEFARRYKEDAYAVDAAHMLAIVDSMNKSIPLEEQLHWNLKAVELAEESQQDNAKKWLGSLYNNIGWTYHDKKVYDKALVMFQKALKFREDNGDDAGVRIARWAVGRCLRSLGRNDEALIVQRVLEKTGASDGYVEEEIGELLLLKGKKAQAVPYFAIAYDKLSHDQWLVEHEPERIERLQQLSVLPDKDSEA